MRRRQLAWALVLSAPLATAALAAGCGSDGANSGGIFGSGSGTGGDDTTGNGTSTSGGGTGTGTGTGTGNTTGTGTGSGGGSGGAGTTSTGTTSTSSTSTSNGSTSSGGMGCQSTPDSDLDADGFTPNQGDCNDCDPNVNPGAIEVIVDQPVGDGGIPMPTDEDCDGQIDNVPQPCDGNIPLADLDPNNGAKAIDLCQFTTPNDPKWGVLAASYVRADGSAFSPGLQVGIQDAFGPNVPVQVGSRMLAISSGHARTPAQPGSCGSLTCTSNAGGSAPPGFPQDVPNCAGSTAINDDVGLQVTVRSPSNATGYSFLFDFYSFEYPEWVCTSYNDQFIALVSPPPVGSINGNISFDSQTNPVSVNIAFFDVCAGCALGTNELVGNGFDIWNDAGATSWLITQAPVTGGGEVTIRFAIWDTGDQAWDSTALIDGFKWIANGGTVMVGTGHM